MRYLFSVSALALMLLPSQAFANCTNPAAVRGDVIFNSDHNVFQGCVTGGWQPLGGFVGPPGPSQVVDDDGPCTSEKAGKLRYDENDTPPWQYCDGTNWVNFKQPQCADDATGECYIASDRSDSDPEFIAANIADGVEILGVTGTLASGGGLSGPMGCANIGDLCADGTVFAGWHPTTHEHLFIPTTDQGSTTNWTTSVGTDDIVPDSSHDGRANTDRVANSSTFPAFKLCKDLSAGGHNDWYLPSRVEMYYLWSIHTIIESSGNITNYLTTEYWTSTEASINNAWRQSFSLINGGLAYGNQANDYKANNKRVRCVRR